MLGAVCVWHTLHCASSTRFPSVFRPSPTLLPSCRYAFIKFDKNLEAKRKQFCDPQSRQNLSKLNESLEDIHSIMKKNIQDVLDRGERLDKVQAASENLLDKSKQFHWGAKKLNLQVWDLC